MRGQEPTAAPIAAPHCPDGSDHIWKSGAAGAVVCCRCDAYWWARGSGGSAVHPAPARIDFVPDKGATSAVIADREARRVDKGHIHNSPSGANPEVFDLACRAPNCPATHRLRFKSGDRSGWLRNAIREYFLAGWRQRVTPDQDIAWFCPACAAEEQK